MIKKFTAGILALASACTLFAGCGGDSEAAKKKGKTVINVINFDGGVGSQWIVKAAKRFEKLKAEEKYEDGKTGVYVDIEKSMNLAPATINTSGYHLYFDEANTNLASLIPSGYLLNINDIVTEKAEKRGETPISIEDKIDPLSRALLKGNDGNYYALPHYTWYPGLTYDVETFDKYNLYFAAPEETETSKYSSAKFGTGTFVKNAKTGKKSCGNDGVYGTADDGLPTSLTELIVLCAKMKQVGVTPFIVSGMYPQYGNYLIEGLWSSLAGDDMDICYTFEGETEVVTGFSNEPLFKGINYIKKPSTQTVTITEETGYKAYDQATRYYATAFMKMIEQEGWFTQSSKTGTVSHTDAQSDFIFGGYDNKPRIGMMIEGSYWYNESVNCENFLDYYEVTQSKSRELKWMPLPTSFDETVTEGNGRTYKVIETGISYAYINANIKEKTGLVRACKEFMQFLYSDEELRAMTVESGSARALDYSLTDEDYKSLTGFQQSVWDLRENEKTDILYCGAENETFKSAFMNFKMNMFTPVYQPTVDGRRYTNYLAAIRAGEDIKDIFEVTRMTTGDWNAVYKG